MSINYEKVKRLKISDWLVIAKGRNKIILKDPKTDEHITIKVDERGIIDAHMTKETKVKTHESILRQDLRELEKQLTEIVKENVKKVNLNDPVLDGCVLVIPLEDKLRKMMVSKGKDLVLSKEALEEKEGDRSDIFSRIKPQDAEKIAATKYLVIDRNGKFVGGLIKRFGNYFFLSLAAIDRISGAFDAKFGELKNRLDEVLGPD